MHFPDSVLGPLWLYTCFEYGDLNGLFLRLIHGTNHIDTQRANSQNQFISMTKQLETPEIIRRAIQNVQIFRNFRMWAFLRLLTLNLPTYYIYLFLPMAVK